MKYGAAIYLGGIRNPYNEGYSVFFNFTDVSEIENAPDSSVIHQVSGYLLSVISNRICLYTWPYLQSFNDETVKRLYELSAAKYNERQSTTGNTIRRGNACRQSVPLENGFYKVAVICGYIEEDIPALEFLFSPTEQKVITDDLSFLLCYNYSI